MDMKQSVLDGNYSVLYSSPESLLTIQLWRNMIASQIYSNKLVAIAIDEAHCIDTW